MLRVTGWFSLGLLLSSAIAAGSPRVRLMIETDAGGDPDDEQSLVRFLLYANEWDVEGIIANRPVAREGENQNEARTGVALVERLLTAYAECYPCLKEHDTRFPEPSLLHAKLYNGDEESDAGVDAIMRAVDAEDPRPLWFSNWGTDHGSASSSLLRALDRVETERGAAGLAAFKQQLRLVSADAFGRHSKQEPPWPLWVDTWRPEQNGRRWYHRFSALTAKAGGFDIERDVRTGHGPLGALYPVNTTYPQKEGDSASFIYLIPTGMNNPEHPEWGSWAGRYARRADFANGRYYWAVAEDAWNGSTHRENSLARWAVDLQNDFRARMDWCVQPREKANHPPHVVVAGADGDSLLFLTVKVGAEVTLDASPSTDPDGDKLTFSWFVYPEVGNYQGSLSVWEADQARAVLTVPPDAGGRALHVMVRVADAGEPALARYGRVVLSVAE